VDKDHCRPRVSGSTILLKSAGNYELWAKLLYLNSRDL
jgi:hypothetical protein